MQKRKHRTLPAIEESIRAAMAAMEAAEDEQSAAAAYAQLRADISEHLRRSGEMRDDYYRLRNTVTKQAHTIADIELVAAVGEAAPGEAPPAPTVQLQAPDVLSIEKAPECLFVRLSFGFVNLLQVAILDVKAKQLYLVGGISRNLGPEDIRALIAHVKLFQARPLTGLTAAQRERFDQLTTAEQKRHDP